MKAMLARPLLLAAAVLLAGLPVVRAESKKSPPPPPDLQVSVNVPPQWRPFLEDDVSEAFADQVRVVFHRLGYKGEIAYLGRVETIPDKKIPHLEIALHEWRIGRSGNAECTFSSVLTTTAGSKDFGLATGTAFFWPQSAGHWGLRRLEAADALESAAGRALRDLYQRVAETGLVAGMAAKK
jgi:hypothetical protein